jgi:lysozyme
MNPIKQRLAAIAVAAILGAGALASQFEGMRYKAYKDPVKITTVCEGHTGADVVPGRLYTPAECAEFKRKDMLIASATIDRCYREDLPLGPRTALVDLAYNLGPGGKGVKDGVCFLRSGQQPRMRLLFNTGRYAEACAQIPKWNAQQLPGITKRREAERKVCVTGL